MPTVDLTYAAGLQNEKRLPLGLGYGGTLDELVRCIPFVKLPGGGESMTISRVTGSCARQ
jgi:hypothetical protein